MGKKTQRRREDLPSPSLSASSSMPFLQERGDHFLLFIYLQPKASRSQVVGVHDNHLKIAVPAAPVEGKANASLLAFLAERFGCAKQNLQILRGHSSRKKVVRIEGVSREVLLAGTFSL